MQPPASRHAALATVLSVTEAARALADAREVARRGARAVAHLLGADTAVYFALDETRQQATAVAGYRVPAELQQPAYRIATADVPPVLRDAGRRSEPVIAAAVADDPGFESGALRSLPRAPRSMVCAPAVHGGVVRGALVLFWWERAYEPGADDVRVATTVATWIALALDATAVAVVAPNRTLFIIARHNEHLYRSLRQTFEDDQTVTVILDRRAAERRAGASATERERRGRERRLTPDVETQLRRRGWAVVTVKPFRR